MNNTQNELGIGYAESQRIAKAEKYNTVRNYVLGVMGAATLATVGYFAIKDVRDCQKALREYAQSAIANEDADAAQKALTRSNNTDMGALDGGLCDKLRETIHKK